MRVDPDQLQALVRGIPFFRDLDRTDLARPIGVLELAHFPAGHTFFTEGEGGGLPGARAAGRADWS